MRTLKTILFWLSAPFLVVFGLAFIGIVTAANAYHDYKEKKP